MKILLVEDDPPTRGAIAEALASHHYNVSVAADGQTGWELAEQFEYDLILLDIIIPKLDGITLCRRIRTQGYQNPILLLTAKESTADRVMGLDAGADDYLIKPFDLQELLARVRALLRRGKAVSSSVMTWENICFDAANNQVSCCDRILHLTPKEYCLLELFLLNPKRIFSRRAILDRLWDFAQTPGEETVSTHIKSLRQKLKAAGAENPIETLHGLGYRLKTPSYAQEPEDSAQLSPTSNTNTAQPQTQEPPPQKQPEEHRRQKIMANMAQVWENSKSRLIEQWQVLEQASITLSANPLPPELQALAQQSAHKLAGSLGIFGLMKGSAIAKEIEHLLTATNPQNPVFIPQISELVTELGQELGQACTPVTASKVPQAQPLLLIVDPDLILAQQVIKDAINWEFRVKVAPDLTIARQIITQFSPDVILLDLNFPGTENGFTLLQELMQRIPKIPVLVFTERSNLSDRLAVMRLGGWMFLQKPQPTYQILNAVANVLNRTQAQHQNRVLIVNHDMNVLEHLCRMLAPFGIEVTTLTDPQQFWDVLTTVIPNLLILDAPMAFDQKNGFQSGSLTGNNQEIVLNFERSSLALTNPKSKIQNPKSIDGLDLCRTVRSDPQWQHLPIVFLGGDADSEHIERAFVAGADDYLSKSIGESEVITRIIHRLERVGFKRVNVARRTFV